MLSSWRGRVIVLAVVGAVIGGPIFVSRATAAPPPVPLRTASTSRGSITQTIAVSGTVTAAAQYKLTFRTNLSGSSTRIAEIYVNVGQQVLAGAPLARLDTYDLVAAQQQADANLASAKARYDQTIAGTAPEDIAQARLSFDNASRSLDQTQKMTDNDITSAKLAVDNAQRNLEQTRRTTQSDIQTAQQTLQRLQTAYLAAKTNFSALTTSIKADAGTLQSTIGTAHNQAQGAIQDIQRSANQNADVISARNSIQSADNAILNAQSSAGTPLQSALDDYTAARDKVLATVSGFDNAIAASADPAAAMLSYQTAVYAYQSAAARLTSAIDVPVGQLGTAKTSIGTAQGLLNSTNNRIYADLDPTRADLANLLITIESGEQNGLKTKVTQAATALTPIGDAVTGGIVSAQQAVGTAQDRAANSIASAQSTVTSAEQSVVSTQVRAESSVAGAQNALESARLSLSKTTASPKVTDVATAYASVLSAQAAADKAKSDVEGATLRAPSNGTVATIANLVGEIPGGSTAFMTFANTATLVLHGTIGEADVAKLRAGQVATITVDAVGATATARMTGRVTSIDPVATIQSGVPVYGTDVQVDIPSPGVRAGMSGTANVIIASRQDVVTVPNLSIRSQGTRRYVQVLKDGQAVDADVVFGISNDTVTEVVSGITDGQLVVLPAPRSTGSTQPRPGGFPGPGGPGPVSR